MSFAVWSLILGLLMTFIALAGSILKRLPISNSMLYLAAGYTLGMADWGPLPPDPKNTAALLERITEVALLISLFSVGMKLGLHSRRRQWWLPVRLASVSMLVTVGLITAAAYFLLGLPLGVAVLLGGVLAPTDPVLAADVQVDDPADRDRLRFSLTGEGGLNDGAAYPFVVLGLGLMGLRDLGDTGLRWLAIDVLWVLIGGLAVGAIIGIAFGRWVIWLRTHHAKAVGHEEFLSLGLIALAYGIAQLIGASGFLAVFATGLAMQRVQKRRRLDANRNDGPAGLQNAEQHLAVATHPELAGPYMMQALRNFNDHIEHLAELVLVLIVGFMLPHTRFDWPTVSFLILLFAVIRPLSVWIGLKGVSISRAQRAMISWFGIRGIGSIYYLMFVLDEGINAAAADEMIALTLTTVAVSIVVHGISGTPLMERYAQHWIKRRR